MKTYDVHDATEESLILAARLRVGRNDAGVCFPHAADPDELAGVKDRVLSALHAACSPGEWEMRGVNAVALMCSVRSGHMMVERMGEEDGSLEDPEIGITRAQVLRERFSDCLLYTSPSPRDGLLSR